MKIEACIDQSLHVSVKHRRYMEKFGGAVLSLASSDPHRPLTPERRAQISRILSDFSPVLTSMPSHITYAAMIHRAISDLKEKAGSSEEAISRFIKSTYRDLPWAHSLLLNIHLGKLCQIGEIVVSSSGCYSLVEMESVPEPQRGRKPKRKRMVKQVNCLGLGEKPGRRRKRQKLSGVVLRGSTEQHIYKKGGGTDERTVDDSDLEEDKFKVGAGKNHRHDAFEQGLHNVEVSIENDKVASDVYHVDIDIVEGSMSECPVMIGTLGTHEEWHTEQVARKLVELGELSDPTESSIDHILQFPETTPSNMLIEYQPDKHQHEVFEGGSQNLDTDIGTQRSWRKVDGETHVEGTQNETRHQVIGIEESNVFDDELVRRLDTPVRRLQTFARMTDDSSKNLDMGILSAKTFSEVMDTHENTLHYEDVGEYEHGELQIGTFKNQYSSLAAENQAVEESHKYKKNEIILDTPLRPPYINDNMADDEVEYLGNDYRGIFLTHYSQPGHVMQNTEKNLQLIKMEDSSFMGQVGSQNFMFTRVLRSRVCCVVGSQHTEHKVHHFSIPNKGEKVQHVSAPIGRQLTSMDTEGLHQDQPPIKRGRGRPRKNIENAPTPRPRPMPHLALPCPDSARRSRGRPSKEKLT